MEPASLGLGIVPLVIGALKAYKAVRDHLRVFRHYTSEVKRLFTRFEAQRCRLEAELDLLLREALPPGPGKQPVRSTDLFKQQGTSALEKNLPALDVSLRKGLGRHTEAFKGLLVSIAEQLQDLQVELKCFDVLERQRSKEESLKEAVLRLRARVKISFDRRRFQDLLDELKNDNDDFCRIASYFEQRENKTVSRREARQMPAEVLRNRAVLAALHESLNSCWTCVDPDHGEHVAKLCLHPLTGPRVFDVAEVRADLAVACLPKAVPNSLQSSAANPIWLYVRTTTQIAQSLQVPAPVKRRRLDATTPGTNDQAASKQMSVCESLSKCRCKSKDNEACLSYSQPTSGLQHHFYHHCDLPLSERSSTRSVALADIVSQVRTDLTVSEQVTLASRLALSTLELYKSPWLPSHWRIKDISSFAEPSSDSKAFLDRLHVTSGISGASTPQPLPLESHWAIANSSSPPDPVYLYAINNDTLFSLGIALLEIAHGKPLEDFRAASDPNLLCTAQRLVQRACPLGERYRNLAQQCLRCDFGCGTELELRGLQDAVYTDVVGQLENVMAALSV